MPDTMNDAERREFLKSIGLNADAPALAIEATDEAPAKVGKKAKTVDPLARIEQRMVPAGEVVFNPEDVEQFDLETQFRAASQHLFDLHKSPTRDKERHALLHRRITEFLGQQRRARKAGIEAPIKEVVKATREQRDIARLLAERGITLADLGKLLGGAE